MRRVIVSLVGIVLWSVAFAEVYEGESGLPLNGGSAVVEVAAGTSATITFTGGGTVTKTGTGALNAVFTNLGDFRGTKFTVAAGSLAYPAVAAPETAMAKASFHLDASDLNTLTITNINNREYITRWNDTRTLAEMQVTFPGLDSAHYPYAYPLENTTELEHFGKLSDHPMNERAPLLCRDGQNGLPFVDFGVYRAPSSLTNENAAPLASAAMTVVGWPQVCQYVAVASDVDTTGYNAYFWDYSQSMWRFYGPFPNSLYSNHGGTGVGAWPKARTLFDGIFSSNPTVKPLGFHSISGINADPEYQNWLLCLSNGDNTQPFSLGGIRIAELVFFQKGLKAETNEIDQIEYYLARKWRSYGAKVGELTLSGGTLALDAGSVLTVSNLIVAVDTTLTGPGRFSAMVVTAQNNAQLTLDNVTFESDTDNVFETFGGETLAKAGSGTLTVPFLDGTRNLAVGAGTLKITGWPSSTYMHLDASRTNTMEITPIHGTNFVTRWHDISGNGHFAEIHKEASWDMGAITNRPRVPFVGAETMNGNTVIDFGTYATFRDADASKSTNGWGGALFFDTSRKGMSTPIVMQLDNNPDQRTVAAVHYRTTQNTLFGGSRRHFIGYPEQLFFKDWSSNRGNFSNMFYRIDNAAYITKLDNYPVPKSTYSKMAFYWEQPEDGSCQIGGLGYDDAYNQLYTAGGVKVAEYVSSTVGWSSNYLDKVMDYFDVKWFGKAEKATRAYAFDSVNVEAGARVEIWESPMNTAGVTIGVLAGGGTLACDAMVVTSCVSVAGGETLTINGDIVLTDGAELRLACADGVLSQFVVNGTLTVTGNVLVSVTCTGLPPDVGAKLPAVVCGSINGSFASDATVTGANMKMKVLRTSEGVSLSVVPIGILLIIR